MRDPLDELIEELERLIPTKPPKLAFDPMGFQWQSAILDAQPAPLPPSHSSERGIGADVPASTVVTAPPVWPIRPVRRPNLSAPTWNDAADTPDTDPDDSGG